jgi:hypothetical protein
MFFQEEYEFELPAPGIMGVEIIPTKVTIEGEPAEVLKDAPGPVQEVQTEAINGAHPEFQHAEPPASQLQLQPQAQIQHQPPIQPLPLLYDMDLERMHMDLYKGKYLTPQDFVEDIHKIVYNAASRVNEDHERFHKAQAMSTAAEVSMEQFDPQFRLECQRMAERERKRRDERKKARGKNSTSDAGQDGTYAPGTRRSARHTGQQPEMSITDPLQLERRLKRARSGDRPSGSPESSEESKAEGSGTPRQPKKRLRTILSDDDELDLLGSTKSQRSKTPAIQPSTNPSSVDAPSDAMAIDSPVPRRSGFDPFLLNPLPPEEDIVRPPNGTTPSPGGHGAQPPPDTDVLPVVPPPREPTRSPTPLPDFHVNEGSLLNLQFQLKTRTCQLTVEQLEQLRATCLCSIWHHRTEWDRDRLVQELLDMLSEFLEDCSAGTSDVAPGSPADLAY